MLPMSLQNTPTQVRERFRKELEKGSKMMRANIKQGTWIASPLWTDMGWKNNLKSYGFSWQNFMKAVRDNYYSFIEWANGEKSWEETIEELIDIINNRIR